MPLLDLGADFVPGATATASGVNAKFDAIEEFVNVTKLDGDNIQDGSIGPTQLDPSLQSALPSSILTALPGSPTNGQIIYYQNAAMATAGVMWQLRYNTAIGGTSKWQFIGGNPLYGQSDISVGPYNPTSYGILAEGPDLTVPLTGVYVVSLSAELIHNGGGPTWLGFTTGGTVGSGDELLGNGAASEHSHTRRRKSLTGGTLMRVAHRSASAVTNLSTNHRVLALEPERVG